MKRLLLLAAVCTALCLGTTVLGGCNRAQQDGSEKPRIALVMKSLANEFFKTMENGAREHQKAHSDQYSLICNGIKNETDVGRQIEIVEQMIAQRVDALVLAPADSKALVPVCKKAQDAGIVVVNIDNKLDDETLQSKGIDIPFVGPDNRKGARMAAEYLAEKKLQAGDKVAIVEGVPNAFNSVQRVKGFEDAMEAASVEIVSSQSGSWMQDEAEQVVAGMISQHPNLDAILCANDNMVLGAISALKSAGKLEQVELIGYDNIGAIQDLIREGTVLCTIDQHADEIAAYGIEYALEMLRKDTKPEDRETPVDLITAEDLK